MDKEKQIPIPLDIIVVCPHCNENVLIDKLNCCIFRHGIIKQTMVQIQPHLNKIECDKLINSKAIYGCGKPFFVKKRNIEGYKDEYIAEVCDYI